MTDLGGRQLDHFAPEVARGAHDGLQLPLRGARVTSV